MVTDLTKAEQLAVERHRLRLCGERGVNVDMGDALSDWMEHHSAQWRQERHVRMLAMEREEILRHKWIESEKGNRDMGSAAALDWIRKYAAGWRKWFESQDEDQDR